MVKSETEEVVNNSEIHRTNGIAPLPNDGSGFPIKAITIVLGAGALIGWLAYVFAGQVTELLK